MKYYHYLETQKKKKAQDFNTTQTAEPAVEISRSIINTILKKAPPKEAFEPALTNSQHRLRFASRTDKAQFQLNVKLESPNYDFREIDKVVAIESMVMRSFWTLISHIMPGADSFRLDGPNPKSVQYVARRLQELTARVGHSPYSFVKEIVENVVRKSNAIVWIRRQRGEVPTYMFMGNTLKKMDAIEVIDPSQVNVARSTVTDAWVGFHLSTTSFSKVISKRHLYMIRYQRISKDHLFGCPFVIPVIDDILSLRRLEEMLDLALGKATFPLYHVAVGDDKHRPMVFGNKGRDNEIERTKQEWQNMAPEGVYISPNWHTVQVIQPRNVADFKPYLEWYRDRIFMGLLMDGPTMGVGDTANRNTANTMSQALINKVRDIQAEVGDQLSRGLIMELLAEGGYDPGGADRVTLMFKDNDLEARMSEQNHHLALFQGGVSTLTETRAALSKKELSEDDIDRDTFLGIQAKFQKQLEAIKAQNKAANQTASKNRPSNQRGTRSSAATRRTRRDYASYERLRNTALTLISEGKDPKPILEAHKHSLIKDILSHIGHETTLTRDIKKQVGEEVSRLIQDICDEFDPTITTEGVRNVFTGRRYRVDKIIDCVLDAESEESDV